MINFQFETQRCLVCDNAPCTQHCPNAQDPARAIRAVLFDNAHEAVCHLGNVCATCSAPCQQTCIQPDEPIHIQEIALQLQQTQPFEGVKPSLEIDFCGVHCENPFFLASSAVCTNYEMVARAFEAGWGGVVFKTIGPVPMNEVSPRFDITGHWEGFRNMEQISENTPEENFAILRRLKREYPTKVVVASIMGQTEDQWIDLAKRSEEAGADIIELNFSCPQMHKSGLGSDVGQNAELVAIYTSLVVTNVTIPVIAKMTPNITHITEPAAAAYIAGAAGLAAINTIKSLTLTERSQVNGRWTISGYSGRAIKPIALRYITELTASPLLVHCKKHPQFSGIGGIYTWRDALDFIELGCQNVQICTAVMEYGYRIIDDLVSGLQGYMMEHSISSLDQLVGKAIPSIVAAGNLDCSTKVFPRWNRETCVGCGRCYVACRDAGHQAITFGDDRVPHLDGKKCVGCHLCRLVCPTSSIQAAKRMPKQV